MLAQTLNIQVLVDYWYIRGKVRTSAHDTVTGLGLAGRNMGTRPIVEHAPGSNQASFARSPRQAVHAGAGFAPKTSPNQSINKWERCKVH